MLCDYIVFWARHRSRPHIIDFLNNCGERKVWDYWRKFFEIDAPLVNEAIEEMKSKSERLRKIYRKK